MSALILVAVLAGTGSCKAMKKVKQILPGGGPPTVKLITKERLNVKPDGQPLGVVRVRACLLTDAKEFLAKSYEQLWQRRDLGSTKIGEEIEVELAPSSAQKIKLAAEDEQIAKAKFIGILVGYYDPEGDGWRQAVPIQHGKDHVEVVVGPRALGKAQVK